MGDTLFDAINNGVTIEKVILLEGTRGEVEKEFRYLCREKGIPMTFAPRERMNKMASGATIKEGWLFNLLSFIMT